MANFTALKTAINNAIKTNGNEEITGAILQAILDAMVETLGDSAITDLENAIATEVTNRENAVGGVAADLAAEVQARQALDYNVNNRINAEEYNRQNADAALSQTMNQGFQTLGSQMTALNAAISALNAAYQNGFLYGGIATPSSSPSNNKCFYIALQGGTYTNFGGVGVVEGINIIKNDSGWKVEHIYDQTTLLNEFYLLRQQVIRAISSIDPIVIQGDVTNAPDEEDLTSNAQHLLKFKDRAYSPLNFSGLGMKILRKNIAPLSDSAAFNGFVEGVTAEETLAGTPELIFWDRMNTRFVGIKDGVYYLDWTGSDNYVPVSTSLVYMYNGTPYQWTGSDFIVDETEVPNLVNCLTQDMINEANTIYIIRYDYTLKENITIPANCVLEFDGGSISGEHTITGNETDILAPIEKIFDGVDIQGTWIVKDIYVEWMKINDYDSVNSEVQSILRLQNDTIYQNVYFPNTTLKFTPLINDSTLCVIASNTHIVVPNTIFVNTNSFPQYRLFYADTKNNITIDGGGTLFGDVDTHECVTIAGWTHEYGHGINIMMCNNVTIKNLTCTKFAGDGISIGGRSETEIGDYDRGSNNIFIENVACTYNGRQGMSVIHGKNYRVLNCVFSNTGNVNTAPLGPWCGVDLEPNHASQGLEDFVFDHCQFQNNGNHGIRLYAGELCNNIQIISCELSTEQGNDYEGEYLIVKNKWGIAQEGNVTNLVVRDSKCHLFEINSRNNEVNIYNSEIYGFFHFNSEPNVKGNTVNLYGCTIKSGKTTMPLNTSVVHTPVFVRCHCVLNFYDCIIDYSQYDPSRGYIGINSAQTLVCNFYNSKGNIFGQNNEIVNSVVNLLNTTSFYPIIGVTILLDNVTFADWKSIQFQNPIMAYPDITTGKAKVIMQNCKFIGSTKAASARDGFIVDYYSRNTDALIVEIADISSLSMPFDYHCAKFILGNKNSKIKGGTILINEDNIPVWWNGVAFVNSKGQTFGKTYGTTVQRPNLLPKDAGYEYFDNSLGTPKPIFFKDITRGNSVVTQSVSRSSDVFVANILTEGVAYEILDGNNRAGGFFGFSKVNTSPTEDDLLIIQNTSNSKSDYFVAPDSSLYPFMYFSASGRQDDSPIEFYVLETVQNWVDATGATV